MKVFLENTGGPSPGLIIHGTRDDLLEFSTQLKEEIGSNADEERHIVLRGLNAYGHPLEGLSFQVTRSLEALIENQARRSKRAYQAATVALVIFAGILYLAYRGSISF